MNFPKKCFKKKETHSLAVCDTIWGEKQFMLIFVFFYWFYQKQVFKQIQIFLRICSFSNIVRKTNFLNISVLVSEIVTFMSKKKSSPWISQKMLQKKKTHSLAVCDTIWGEKQFMLIFVFFYWFYQKQVFKQIQIFLRICSFSNIVRKTNFLNISVLVSEIVTFMSKKKTSPWISPKTLQKKRNA